MKICTHKGMLMAVLTRNEHCPPHVHVASALIEAASFDVQRYRTILQLKGASSPVEIEL